MKKKNNTKAASATNATSDKQQPLTIDENCATGSSAHQTGNGDIPQQHAPPLQVCKFGTWQFKLKLMQTVTK